MQHLITIKACWLLSFVILSFNSFGQNEKIITGRVTDASDNTALPGVNIIAKGTSIGTVSNIEGKFSLAVPQGTELLVISSIGYVRQEIPLNNQSEITVALSPDVTALSEVVVIGYGTVKKRDVTGSVASVSEEQLASVPLTSVDQVLQGRIAGVEVTQGNFTPGDGATVRIRGGNSMLGGNDPLYIIDGFPGDFSSINPNDIESIEVLKDASATAIYGARGANGVVLITTKRGSLGQAKVELRSTYGIQQLREKLDLLNARQYATLANEKAANIGRDPYFPDLDSLPGSTDWQDVVFRDAPIRNYSLSIYGGNEGNRYAVLGGYFSQDGIVKNTDFRRANIRVNLDNEINDWFSISTSIAAIHETQNRSLEGFSWNNVVTASLQTPPVAPVFDAAGDYFFIGNLPTADPEWDNPLVKIDGFYSNSIQNNFLGNTHFKFSLSDDLEFSVRLAADYTHTRQDRYTKRIIPGTGNGGGGVNGQDEYRLLNENILSYARTFGNRHQINALIGFTAQEDNFYQMGSSASEFISDQLLTNNLGAGEIINGVTTDRTNSTILSYLGRINYVLDDKYLLTFTARADGSSRLGENNKWGYFPSGAVGWRVSEEGFLKDISAITELKVRASLGTTGNQEIGLYNSLSRLSGVGLTTGVNEGRAIGFVPQSLENPDLKWEVTRQLDIGLDLGLFDQRLEITLDYYQKNTEDLLARVPLGMSSGYSDVLLNFGSMRNEGFELSLSTNVYDRDKFKWNIMANISANTNEVVQVATETGEFFAPSLQSPINASVNIIREDYPLSSYFGFLTDGLWESDQTDESIQPNALAGDQRYVDVNGDGMIGNEDKVILGNPYPDFTYGFNSMLSYGSFDLNVLIQGARGASIFNGLGFTVADNFARNANQITDALNRWTESNRDATYPRLSNTGPLVSDRFVEDASYLRLREISLAYNLPVQNMNINWINQARIYVNAQNLLTFTDFSGFDPEVRGDYGTLINGVDYGTYPAAKTYNVGINVIF